MLETGQPLHAFDYHLLQGRAGGSPGPDGRQARPAIVVRRAAEGEKFMTLDGQERTLTSQMLLIADETKAVALAGVMGGQNSEISLNTVDVLIESACFKPQNIRATSKKLDLRTRVLLPLRARGGHRHLRLGQPARGPVDSRNGRRRAGRRRRGRLPEAPCAEANHLAACADGCRARRRSSACSSKLIACSGSGWRSLPLRRRSQADQAQASHDVQRALLPRGPETRGGPDRGSRAALMAWTKFLPRRRAAPSARTRLTRCTTRLRKRAAS